MASPEKIYTKRSLRLGKLASLQAKYTNTLSNLRLLTFVAGLILSFLAYRINSLLGVMVFLLGLGAFVYLVLIHHKTLTRTKLTQALVQINQTSVKRLTGEWVTFQDTGEEFINLNHSFSGDLDIFGKGSLFQLINSTQTFLGRHSLYKSLVEPVKQKAWILNRQEAIHELSVLLPWRQRLTAQGMVVLGKQYDPEPLLQWIKQRQSFYRKSWVKYVFRTLPIVTLASILLHYLVPKQLPLGLPICAVVIQFFLLMLFGKKRAETFNTVYGFESSIKVYAESLKLIESQKFNSLLLQELQSGLKNSASEPAWVQVRKLSKLVDSLSNRNNAMFFVVNVLTLWDYQCMIALEQWKAESGKLLSRWLSALGELEALSSLSQLQYDNPDWVIPTIDQEPPIFSARSMGHPLLSKGRVCNDLRLDPTSNILLITGSNMSGKSTLLRTVGINLVLAYSGAPVCAHYLRSSIMDLYSCMRISDNLEQSISSFYAELLRIKQIVQASSEPNQIFFLLDEIFKGTNSQDRHTGAKVLINQLNRQGAMGLVSTHDLELGDLEKESGKKIRNYHFREYYRNDEIQFDYKLRPGLSTTRNALYLIRLAGIEVAE